MKHKLLRGLVALVLVCVLVVNVSPIRAQASALPEVAEVVTKVIPFNPQAGAAAGGAALGSQVFGWVLLGLGLIVTTAQAVEIMNAYSEFSGELETSIYYYPDGSWSYGVDMGFVERVRTFLFDEGYLIAPGEYVVTVPEGVSYRNYTPRVPCVAYNYCYAYSSADKSKWWFETSGYLVSLIPNDPYVISGQKSTTYITVNENKHYALCTISGTKTTTENKLGELAANEPTLYYFGKQRMFPQDVWNYFGWTGVCGSTDVDIGYVGAPSVPMPDAYPEWHTNARPAVQPDTNEEITVLPIPFNPSSDTEALPDGVTQEDVWPGSVADPMPDTDTDTGTDTNVSETPWETFKKWISTGWDAIIEAIPTPQSIAEAVGNVIKSIFVPDADFISEKWNAIRSRFDFADSISSSGELILDVLNGIDPEPPVIYVDLGDAEGSYYLGGQVAFLDLRWYERYKPTGDAIISAFLWLVFVWRMFIKLPGIIGGLPGDFVMQGVTDLGLADRLPARKKEYENQRQENRRFFKK